MAKSFSFSTKSSSGLPFVEVDQECIEATDPGSSPLSSELVQSFFFDLHS